MSGVDKATKRVVAVLVLLVLAAAGLRGYLPGAQRAPREQPATDSPVSLFAVVALLSVATAIIVIAIFARLRDARAVAGTTGGRLDWFRRNGEGRSWRLLLIGIAVILAWLLIVMLLARIGAPRTIDQPASGPGPGTGALSGGSTVPPPPAPTEPDQNLAGYLGAATAILLLAIGAGTIAEAGRRRRATAPYATATETSAPPTPAAGSESLARAAELGLAEIGDLSREPREAIIACYAAMEHGLANAPEAVPRDSDTPSEVLARAVEHHALRADNATQLVDLFAEARFSPHIMNEGHREIAVRVLRLVLTELRSMA
jgi:hypothetical protein